ncbi:MAG: DUF1343 domain-containing protein, partial [Melioribacteraceae bacterium]|nr:DUF1343 domain-containing protein [Melioribacteraceae bacterium]
RGTLSPFLKIGSPYLDSKLITEEINKLEIEGISIKPSEFTPVEIPNMSKYPKYKDEKCYGIEITITDRRKFKPINFSVHLLYLFNSLYPEKFSIKDSRMGKLWGSYNLAESLRDGSRPEEIINQYTIESEKFIEQRKNYLLYN